MRISIITLAVDSSSYLDEALDSVERRGPFELEHIVVHDGSDSFAQRLALKYSHIKVLRGGAAGATAAAALGVQAATGEFILFLHSDDRLCPGVLARLANLANAQPDVKIWTGGAQIFCTLLDGRELVVRRIVGEDMTRLSLENICDDMPILSARFVHRSVFSKIGNFDSRFSESSDREFLLRAAIAGIPEGALDVVVSEMRMHQRSRTIHFRDGWVPPYFEEHHQIADMWLARMGIAGRARRFLRSWRARETVRLIIYQCRAGRWKEAAFAFFNRGLAEPLWVFRALTILAVYRRRHRCYDWEALKQWIRDTRLMETQSGR